MGRLKNMILPDDIESRSMMDSEIIEAGFKTITFKNEGESKTSNNGKQYLQIKAVSDTGVKFSLLLWKDSDSRVNLIRSWGAETNNWIGRVAKIEVRDYQNALGEDKQVITLHATEAKEEVEMPEPEETKDKDIPVVDPIEPEKKGKINVADIPF